MKGYRVKYYIGKMYHTYVIRAKNEAHAIQCCLNGIPEECLERFHDFSIERYVEEWN